MRHQDTLAADLVESLAKSIWPFGTPFSFSRLYSENHQVYRVKGKELDVVLKIEGKGVERTGQIIREMETISALSGIACVPEIVKYGITPRPYIVMPYYQKSSLNSTLLDHASANNARILSSLNKYSVCKEEKMKREKIRALLGSLERALVNDKFVSCYKAIENVIKVLPQVITSDNVICGQHQPSEVILLDDDYVAIDWSEGLEPCLSARQIAHLTYHATIENIDLALEKIKFFNSYLQCSSVPEIAVIYHWCAHCIDAAFWLSEQHNSSKPLVIGEKRFTKLMQLL